MCLQQIEGWYDNTKKKPERVRKTKIDQAMKNSKMGRDIAKARSCGHKSKSPPPPQKVLLVVQEKARRHRKTPADIIIADEYLKTKYCDPFVDQITEVAGNVILLLEPHLDSLSNKLDDGLTDSEEEVNVDKRKEANDEAH